MKESLEDLKEQLDDKEYRYGYVEAFMNSYIAAQIKILREQRDLTQTELAEMVGTKQGGISRLENVNYTAWKVETLTRLAKAFDLRLRISFEEFCTLPDEIGSFSRATLERNSYEDDAVFGSSIDDVADTSVLSPSEAKALSGNVIPFVKQEASLPGERNAPTVDTLSEGRGLYAAGGTESRREGVFAKSG
jgi:transcriptional regulator with XRE-family HTH domain